MNCEEFIDSINKTKMPLGYGLIYTDFKRVTGPVVEVQNPAFQHPLPLDDREGPLKLLMVPTDVVQQVVLDLRAIAIPSMPFWFRFPVWK